ncbi:MAG: hypothetical protein L6R41_004214 [Letrouitia leprolyta]|nr:MAG: hypothetical protein L6R41_004214 [Letrouitia leprolyta]
MTASTPTVPTEEPEIEDNMDMNMAEAMGFSSFGSRPALKKRKITHSQQAGLGKGKGNASGGNTIPLGKGRREREKRKVDVVGDGSDSLGGNPGVGEEEIMGADDGRVSMGKSLVGKDQDGGIGTDHEASITAFGSAEENAKEIPTADETRADPPLVGISAPTFGIEAERSRDNNNNTVLGQVLKGGQFQGHSWKEWRQGVRDERGDMAYFDSSFVEDPWRRLRGKESGDG